MNEQTSAAANDANRPNTTAEMLAVLQAHAEGAQIESRLISPRDRPWTLAGSPRFNFAARQYRVKPRTPVEAWLVFNRHDRVIFGSTKKHIAETALKRSPSAERVALFREVIED